MAKIFKKLILNLKDTFLEFIIANCNGQSIAEFAVVTAMMSTFVSTAAPRLSSLMEDGKGQKSIQEIDKLVMQAKTFYENTANLEGRGRLPGQDKFDMKVGSYTDTTEAFNDLRIYNSYSKTYISSKWVSVFDNQDGNLFQMDKVIPDLDDEGNIQCDNCPQLREAGHVEWYNLFNRSMMDSPFQDGHYIYVVIPGSGSGESFVAPRIIIADAENPMDFHKILDL
tara:strand:- start:258 stop:932 length:675 start_codon:yes stop_codon:yes gene_type:complete